MSVSDLFAFQHKCLDELRGVGSCPRFVSKKTTGKSRKPLFTKARTCRSVSQSELLILRNRERAMHSDTRGSNNICPLPDSMTLFSGTAFRGLNLVSQSVVARTSLSAKVRWEWALRRVLTMRKVVRMFVESVM
jgi:hypothetical protein